MSMERFAKANLENTNVSRIVRVLEETEQSVCHMNVIKKESYRSGHNGADSKSVRRESAPRVRIPPTPLTF